MAKTSKGETVKMPSADEVFLLHALCDTFKIPRRIPVDDSDLTLYERVHMLSERLRKRESA